MSAKEFEVSALGIVSDDGFQKLIWGAVADLGRQRAEAIERCCALLGICGWCPTQLVYYGDVTYLRAADGTSLASVRVVFPPLVSDDTTICIDVRFYVPSLAPDWTAATGGARMPR